MFHILELPLYFVTGMVAVLHIVIHLPWPSVNELFRSLVMFLVLYPVRNYMEKRWLKRRLRHKPAVKAPSPAEHQAAVASLSDILTHV